MGKMKVIRIILVPYPAQGHITPMLNLASALLNHGLEPVMVVPEYIHRQIIKSPTMDGEMNKILWKPIPDGMSKDTEPPDFFSIETAMENTMPSHLEKVVRELGGGEEEEEDGGGGNGVIVGCMVVDLLASWAIQVASRCGVPAAGFWPAMFATYRLITAIPDMIMAGFISDSGFPQHSKHYFLPCEPILSMEDLPWLIGNLESRKARFKFWTRTLNRSRSLKWLLVNSFPEEKLFHIDHHQHQNQLINISKNNNTTTETTTSPIVFAIGPLSKLAKTKNVLSLRDEDKSCLKWLDKQKPQSVIYISFGSWVSPIGEDKVKNLAMALEAFEHPFLWVLGSNWRKGLPKGYLERVVFSKKAAGQVVSWAPQIEVLKHSSVGCFLTHCGWNSTMEAIQFRKRLLCFPIAGDQFVNSIYIVKVWRIGIRINNGFGQSDIEEGLRMVMEDTEMNERLKKVYEKTMGEEAIFKVELNLKAFVDDATKICYQNCMNSN
ncbi:UDP-glycosyltransferase 82A1 [Ziziphus jujuba]|uniref:Glycosyltransferase n=1 Tax=Ziziphus jujuba TaxID=326968 RepID=A0A6P6FRA1_ZIZJJ|nr:UDP-glycosyltransferase 82A1 [Ziziphus jujuba]